MSLVLKETRVEFSQHIGTLNTFLEEQNNYSCHKAKNRSFKLRLLF